MINYNVTTLQAGSVIKNGNRGKQNRSSNVALLVSGKYSTTTKFNGIGAVINFNMSNYEDGFKQVTKLSST